jgi:hypothetical protein
VRLAAEFREERKTYGKVVIDKRNISLHPDVFVYDRCVRGTGVQEGHDLQQLTTLL